MLDTGLAVGFYKEVQWVMLIPKGWVPAAQFMSLNLSTLSDGGTKAMEALQAMKKFWDNAPAEPSMNGRSIRIPGFMIPLDKTGASARSFLLVLYFGACMHSLAAFVIQPDGAGIARKACARLSYHGYRLGQWFRGDRPFGFAVGEHSLCTQGAQG